MSAFMSKFKKQVIEYAENHTSVDVLSFFKDYGVNAKWLKTNKIDCKKINKDALTRNYINGASISDLVEIYGIDESQVRCYIKKANIHIREDENKHSYADEYVDLPQLHTGDLVWIKNGKYSVDRDKFPLTNEASRVAVVLSPRGYLEHNNNKNANIAIVYGTTNLHPDDVYCFTIDCKYTGKNTTFNANTIDTVKLSDIDYPRTGTFVRLSSNDLNKVKMTIANYLGVADFCNEYVPDAQIAVLEAKLSVYENIFNKVETIKL
jgi:hypothetical protein